MTAGDDTQAAGITRQRIKVERDLDIAQRRVTAVRVPGRVVGVVVAVGTHIIKVVPEQTAKQTVDARFFKQRTEPLMLVDKRHDTGALRRVVRLAVVPAAACCPDFLERGDDLRDTVGQRSGQCQKTERIEEFQLFRCEIV